MLHAHAATDNNTNATDNNTNAIDKNPNATDNNTNATANYTPPCVGDRRAHRGGLWRRSSARNSLARRCCCTRMSVGQR
jgi:hypothetical protein